MKFKTIKHYNTPNNAHELTFSCYKKQPFFDDDIIKHFFVDSVKQVQKKYQFDVWAYVIMPDHIHILIMPLLENYTISNILKSIKQSVARKTLIYYRKNKPEHIKLFETGQKHTQYLFWQDGGGFDKNVVFSSAVRNMVEYIHYNPVRRGLVEKQEDWRWSSAREWMGIGKGHIPLNLELFPQI